MGRLTSAQMTHQGGANHMLLQLLEARCWIVTMWMCGIRSFWLAPKKNTLEYIFDFWIMVCLLRCYRRSMWKLLYYMLPSHVDWNVVTKTLNATHWASSPWRTMILVSYLVSMADIRAKSRMLQPQFHGLEPGDFRPLHDLRVYVFHRLAVWRVNHLSFN